MTINVNILNLHSTYCSSSLKNIYNIKTSFTFRQMKKKFFLWHLITGWNVHTPWPWFIIFCLPCLSPWTTQKWNGLAHVWAVRTIVYSFISIYQWDHFTHLIVLRWDGFPDWMTLKTAVCEIAACGFHRGTWTVVGRHQAVKGGLVTSIIDGNVSMAAHFWRWL